MSIRFKAWPTPQLSRAGVRPPQEVGSADRDARAQQPPRCRSWSWQGPQVFARPPVRGSHRHSHPAEGDGPVDPTTTTIKAQAIDRGPAGAIVPAAGLWEPSIPLANEKSIAARALWRGTSRSRPAGEKRSGLRAKVMAMLRILRAKTALMSANLNLRMHVASSLETRLASVYGGPERCSLERALASAAISTALVAGDLDTVLGVVGR